MTETTNDIERAAALAQRGRLPSAIAHCRRALTRRADSSLLWHHLAHALWRAGRLEEAKEAAAKAIEQAPAGFISPRWLLGSICSDMGHPFEAIDHYNIALRTNPTNHAIKLDRALAFLLGGDLQTGFREYEARIDHLKRFYPDMPMPRWHGQDAIGKTILVSAEQGIGDIIMFSRYLPWLATRCKRIIFRCPAELISLFASWPRHIIDSAIINGVDIVADFHVPLGSLPMIHGTSINTIPRDLGFFRRPICGDDDLVIEGPRFKIGICWAGNPTHGRDRDRSIALEHFLELAALPEVALYSFQVGQRAGDIQIVGAESLIHDLSPGLTHWGKTAAALECMDAVVTVDSAVAHLAGAIGRPTYILLPKSPDWRWGLSGVTTPWYPTARLIRLERAGDWETIMEQHLPSLIQLEL